MAAMRKTHLVTLGDSCGGHRAKGHPKHAQKGAMARLLSPHDGKPGHEPHSELPADKREQGLEPDQVLRALFARTGIATLSTACARR